MFAMGRKQTAALPPITIPNQLLLKRQLSAVERPFVSADATGKHYAAAALDDCRRVATTLLPRAKGIAHAQVLPFSTPATRLSGRIGVAHVAAHSRRNAPTTRGLPVVGTPDGMVTSSSPRAISNALRLPRAGHLAQSTPRGSDLPSSGSGKCIQGAPAGSPRAVSTRRYPGERTA